MLVLEDCMPFCPFKRTHDDLQIYYKTINYWDSYMGGITCERWGNKLGKFVIPRSGTNCFWSSINAFNEYAELVDIFKYSGRLTNKGNEINYEDYSNLGFGWAFRELSHKTRYAVRSFHEIIENKLEPIYFWFPKPDALPYLGVRVSEIHKGLKDNLYTTEKAKKLEQVLMNCKSQCYRCHLCERTFGIQDFDSLIEL
jgi:hypothetical protein